MASVDPLLWSSDEFRAVLLEEHPTDIAYVDAALAAYVKASSSRNAGTGR